MCRNSLLQLFNDDDLLEKLTSFHLFGRIILEDDGRHSGDRLVLEVRRDVWGRLRLRGWLGDLRGAAAAEKPHLTPTSLLKHGRAGWLESE